MNLKFPLLNSDKLYKLAQQEFVYGVNQIENKEARQLREVGYSEVIFGQRNELKQVMDDLEILNNEFSDHMESIFYNNAQKLAEEIKNN